MPVSTDQTLSCGEAFAAVPGTVLAVSTSPIATSPEGRKPLRRSEPGLGGPRIPPLSLVPARAEFLADVVAGLLDDARNRHIVAAIKGDFDMGIFSRARDILQANVSDLLDKAEDPAKTIRLVIMEMEETLVEVRASAARTIADQKEMRRTVLKLEQAQANWADKAELALSKGREDLATAALVEKQKVGQVAAQLRDEGKVLDEQLAGHEDDIAKLEAKLREARSRQNALMARLETAQNRARVRSMTRGPRVEEAFSRFELIERRVDLDGTAAA